MSLLAFAHLLLGRPMQKRFGSDPLFQATTLLLQERVPRAMATYSRIAEVSDLPAGEGAEASVRVIRHPDTPSPELQLLSNGRYHVMVTNAGSGYSRWHDLAVTRWREDSTCDNWGSFVLYSRPAVERVLVRRVSTRITALRQLRGHLLRRARRIPPQRPRLRYPHGDRRLARRRYRVAAHHHHQHRALAPDHRSHQLRGGGTGPGGSRRVASRVQQPLRADGGPPERGGHSLHPPAAFPRGTSAMVVPSDGGSWSGSRRRLL